MAIIILPNRRREKPCGPVEVDRGNPQSLGLLSLWTWLRDRGTAEDIVNRKAVADFANPGRIFDSKAYPGFEYLSASTQYSTLDSLIAGNPTTTPFTICGTMYWMPGGTGTVPIRDWTDAAGTGTFLFNGSPNLKLRCGGTTFDTGKPASDYQNKWIDFAITNNGSSARLYMDGVDVGGGAPGTSPVASPWVIGRNGAAGQYTNARFSEVRLYNWGLPPSLVWDMHMERAAVFKPLVRRTYVFGLHPTIIQIAKASFGYAGKAATTNARENVGVTRGAFAFSGRGLVVNAREVLAVANAAFSSTGRAVSAIVQSGQTMLVNAARFVWSGAALLVPGAGTDSFTWLPWIRTRDRVRASTTVPKD